MKVMKTPRRVELEITSRCNLRCSYCYHFTSGGDVDRDLPADEWLSFFEELGRCGVMGVTLSGGEPFLREDLEPLIEGIVANRLRFTILSNGTLVTADRAAFLARTGRCDAVQISIDGAAAASHEACRGRGSYAAALQGVVALRRAGIPVEVRVTIHRHNVDDLEEIARLLLEELGLPGFSTNSASHLGLCRENREAVQLGPAERQRAMETLIRLERRYPGRIRASAGPLAEAGLWAGMEEARERGLANRDGCGYLSACGGVTAKIAVRADGVMVPCSLLSHLELGRINEVRLSEVWRHHPELNRLRERRRVPLGEIASCAGCEYIPYCRGGCPALAADRGSSPEGCYKRFLDQGGRLPRKL
jgi:SynChlorMet cassette radical SAM/SPASM protein ScmE